MTRAAVLDVNILASAVANPTGTPARIVDLGLAWEMYTVVVSPPLIDELREVLTRPYFVKHLTERANREYMALIEDRAVCVEVKGLISGVADDAEDDRIIATAVAGGAEAIVTGDKGLLRVGEYRSVRIVTAAAFLAELDGEAAVKEHS